MKKLLMEIRSNGETVIREYNSVHQNDRIVCLLFILLSGLIVIAYIYLFK
jgi:hypothetical protein